MTNVDARIQSLEGEHHELVRSICVGGLGALWLGHAKVGAESQGRVLLRELAAEPTAELYDILDAVAALAHPRLLPAFGLTSIQGRRFCVSEYVEGLPLRALLSSAKCLAPEITLRIVLDLLHAVMVARRELSFDRVRYAYSDCVWIADFGETLLMEPGVAHQLHQGLQARPAGARALEADAALLGEQLDVDAITGLLRSLLTGTDFRLREASLRSGERAAWQCFLQQLDAATGKPREERCGRLGELLAMTEALPASCFASTAEVAVMVKMALAAQDTTHGGRRGRSDGEGDDDPWDVPTRSMTLPVAKRFTAPDQATARPGRGSGS